MHRDIRESSGVVRSVVMPGAFWTHNDSGNDERLFAFDSTGADLGAVTVTGSRNRDWEALAAGPCHEGRCLYVGDVGNNAARPGPVTIWRIPEPVPPGRGAVSATPPAVALRFTYAGGPHDVEAMWVDADTATWLATKRRLRGARGEIRPTLVHRLPASAWHGSGVAVAELVDSLPNIPAGRTTQVTDASLADPFGETADGGLLAVRTYDLLYVFRVNGTSGRPGALVARCMLAALGERQGEGVVWLADGRVLLTSERRFAPLQAARCP